MKKWRRCLSAIWRWVRIPVAVVMTLSLCLMCMAQIILRSSKYETYMSRTVTPEGGNFRAIYIAKSRPELTLGGGEDFLAMIVLSRGNERGPVTRVFVYEPTYDNKYYEPRIKWLSPTHLEISVDKVDHIYNRKMEALGITITYRIGEVVHP